MTTEILYYSNTIRINGCLAMVNHSPWMIDCAGGVDDLTLSKLALFMSRFNLSFAKTDKLLTSLDWLFNKTIVLAQSKREFLSSNFELIEPEIVSALVALKGKSYSVEDEFKFYVDLTCKHVRVWVNDSIEADLTIEAF